MLGELGNERSKPTGQRAYKQIKEKKLHCFTNKTPSQQSNHVKKKKITHSNFIVPDQVVVLQMKT